MDLIDANWRKASRSADNGGHCVEVASGANAVAIRDSKDPHGPKILVSRENFRRFAEALKNI
ncbi:DUF397 domain-containing protein [Actinomadura pelletieri]|uniref:DUF397 domain-containing protein n=1 Tax=Actinomadura pelletieri TaxID=111805 RepID=UPI000EAC4311|nr:DUF397 domain-containing protein [Actinomadura pelletieri]